MEGTWDGWDSTGDWHGWNPPGDSQCEKGKKPKKAKKGGEADSTGDWYGWDAWSGWNPPGDSQCEKKELPEVLEGVAYPLLEGDVCKILSDSDAWSNSARHYAYSSDHTYTGSSSGSDSDSGAPSDSDPSAASTDTDSETEDESEPPLTPPRHATRRSRRLEGKEPEHSELTHSHLEWEKREGKKRRRIDVRFGPRDPEAQIFRSFRATCQ